MHPGGVWGLCSVLCSGLVFPYLTSLPTFPLLLVQCGANGSLHFTPMYAPPPGGFCSWVLDDDDDDGHVLLSLAFSCLCAAHNLTVKQEEGGGEVT